MIGDHYQQELEDMKDLDWHEADTKELGRVLTNPSLKKALALVARDAQESIQSFRGLDLTTQAGVAEGIKLQGRADGVLGVIQSLCDLATERK